MEKKKTQFHTDIWTLCKSVSFWVSRTEQYVWEATHAIFELKRSFQLYKTVISRKGIQNHRKFCRKWIFCWKNRFFWWKIRRNTL